MAESRFLENVLLCANTLPCVFDVAHGKHVTFAVCLLFAVCQSSWHTAKLGFAVCPTLCRALHLRHTAKALAHGNQTVSRSDSCQICSQAKTEHCKLPGLFTATHCATSGLAHSLFRLHWRVTQVQRFWHYTCGDWQIHQIWTFHSSISSILSTLSGSALHEQHIQIAWYAQDASLLSRQSFHKCIVAGVVPLGRNHTQYEFSISPSNGWANRKT